MWDYKEVRGNYGFLYFSWWFGLYGTIGMGVFENKSTNVEEFVQVLKHRWFNWYRDNKICNVQYLE